VDANGNFVVAWRDNQQLVPTNPAPPNDIYFRRFAAAGTALSGDVVVNAVELSHSFPNVAVDRQTGAFLVAHTAHTSPGTTWEPAAVRQYDAGGNPQGDPIQVSGSAAQAAWQPGGKFVLALHAPDANFGGTFVQRYEPAPAVTPTTSISTSLLSDAAIAEDLLA
jgi:hypothetical protein